MYGGGFSFCVSVWRWFQFLCERMEVAKYSSREQVEVFVSMLQKSLTVSVGKPHNIMSRHVTAVGTRFRYTSQLRWTMSKLSCVNAIVLSPLLFGLKITLTIMRACMRACVRACVRA